MSTLIEYVNTTENPNTLDYARRHQIDHQVVIGDLKALESAEKLQSIIESFNKLELTEEGIEVSRNGSHEYRLFTSIPNEGIEMDKLIRTAHDKIGFAKAKTNNWISITEKDGVKYITKNESLNVVDRVSKDLSDLDAFERQGDTCLVKEYKKRKLVKDVTVKYFVIKKGPRFYEEIDTDSIAVLDAEYISKNLDVEDPKFKKYNMKGGIPERIGLHPLMKMRSEYNRILIEMGFQAMPTNNYVESSFWNFDALFQPQDHAARDAHDTFFLTRPQISEEQPSEYLHRVKQVHSNGGYGSQGYKNPWKLEEAQKNLMRTHTTAVSARMLYKLALKKEFEPVKYFSIDRVFRNESLDATHLAEFHQVEGLIADRGISLASLESVIRAFFKRLGINDIEFKPAYNPYTEPSMEIFGYHPGLQKWIEIGNSGMFRPEMLLPMGLPEDVNVIAWGLSLERPTMIKYGINNIREMLGPKMDLRTVWNSPMCVLEY